MEARSTKVTSSDGQEFILMHLEPITEDEIAVFKQFTGDEIREVIKKDFGLDALPMDGWQLRGNRANGANT